MKSLHECLEEGFGPSSTSTQWGQSSYTSKGWKSFPPPLSHSLPEPTNNSPHPSSDSFCKTLRPYRKDGRFILEEVRTPCKHYFGANRSNGRLTLHLFTREQELEEEEGEEEEEEDDDDEEQEQEQEQDQKDQLELKQGQEQEQEQEQDEEEEVEEIVAHSKTPVGQIIVDDYSDTVLLLRILLEFNAIHLIRMQRSPNVMLLSPILSSSSPFSGIFPGARNSRFRFRYNSHLMGANLNLSTKNIHIFDGLRRLIEIVGLRPSTKKEKTFITKGSRGSSDRKGRSRYGGLIKDQCKKVMNKYKNNGIIIIINIYNQCYVMIHDEVIQNLLNNWVQELVIAFWAAAHEDATNHVIFYFDLQSFHIDYNYSSSGSCNNGTLSFTKGFIQAQYRLISMTTSDS